MSNMFEQFSFKKKESPAESPIGAYDKNYDPEKGVRLIELPSGENPGQTYITVMVSQGSMHKKELENLLFLNGFSKSAEGQKNSVYEKLVNNEDVDSVRSKIVGERPESDKKDQFRKAA